MEENKSGNCSHDTHNFSKTPEEEYALVTESEFHYGIQKMNK